MSRNHGAVLEQLGRLFGRGTVAGLSEGSLLQRFAQGKDEAAFAALVARHGPMVLGVCRRVLRDEHDVEDAFQATFLILVRRAGAIRHGELVGHWLYGVAHRVALRARANAAKRHARSPLFAETDGLETSSALKDRNHELRAIIDEELARLPDSVRAPIVLCYLEGLTHEEAASRLGWPVGTVRSRMARGRDTLRHRLSRRGVTANDATLGSVLAPMSLSLPTPLLDATVKASLSFLTTGATSAALASVSALSLAQGVLYAMTLTKISALGAVALSGAIAFGGWQTYGRPSQDGGQPPATRSSDTPARVTELETKLEKIAARLESLQKENQDLRRLLEVERNARPAPSAPSALPTVSGGAGIPGPGGGFAGEVGVSGGLSTPAPAALPDHLPTTPPLGRAVAGQSPFEAEPKSHSPMLGGGAGSAAPAAQAGMMGGRAGMMGFGGMPSMAGGGGMSGKAGGMMPGGGRGSAGMSGQGMMGGMIGMGGGMAGAVDENQPQIQRVGDMVFAFSPGGKRVSVYDIVLGNAQSLTLSDSKETRHKIKIWAVDGLYALDIEGPGIKRIATYANGAWFPQDLVKPTDHAGPTLVNGLVGYDLGDRFYAFSASARRWGVLEIPGLNRSDRQVQFHVTHIEFTQNGHLYRFDAKTAEWRDFNIDPNAILNAPEPSPGSTQSQKER